MDIAYFFSPVPSWPFFAYRLQLLSAPGGTAQQSLGHRPGSAYRLPRALRTAAHCAERIGVAADTTTHPHHHQHKMHGARRVFHAVCRLDLPDCAIRITMQRAQRAESPRSERELQYPDYTCGFTTFSPSPYYNVNPRSRASFLGSFGFFFGLARSFFARIIGRADIGIIRDRLRQLFDVVNILLHPVIGGNLVIVIHLDRIKRAVFGAHAAVHANINIDIKLRRRGHRPPGNRVGCAHDPDALRRASLGANPARGAAHDPSRRFRLLHIPGRGYSETPRAPAASLPDIGW
jgi:hypothetical protein